MPTLLCQTRDNEKDDWQNGGHCPNFGPDTDAPGMASPQNKGYEDVNRHTADFACPGRVRSIELHSRSCLSAPLIAALALPSLAMAGLALPGVAMADTGRANFPQTGSSLSLTMDHPLRFGSFAVLGSGSKQVSADGSVVNDGIVSLGTSRDGPAQFTLTYVRGTGETKPMTAIVQIYFGKAPAATSPGVTGQISSYETDLGGLATLSPGSGFTYTFTNCAGPTCAVTFHVGARLDVTSASEGAPLIIALPISARILSEN